MRMSCVDHVTSSYKRIKRIVRCAIECMPTTDSTIALDTLFVPNYNQSINHFSNNR